jgi:hypothetical protein
MKRFLSLLVISLLCFTFVACTAKTNEKTDSDNNIDKLSIDNTLTFESEINGMVFYYNGDTLQKGELINFFDTEEAAQEYEKIYKIDEDYLQYYSNITCEGKTVTMEYSEESMVTYKQFTKEFLKTYMVNMGYELK